MAEQQTDSVVWTKILAEQGQSHETRQAIYSELEEEFGRPVVALFTSFRYPVSIEDADADMLEGILQQMDLTEGFVLELPSIGWLLSLPDSSPNDWIASCPTVVTFATRLLTEPLSHKFSWGRRPSGRADHKRMS
jgi:hypothetical protein